MMAKLFTDNTFILLLVLVAATLTDATRHRIPNPLTLGGILIAIAWHSWMSGWLGLLNSLGGLALGLLLLLPLYLRRVMGAGDVKLMATAGAFLGWSDTLIATSFSLMAGGVFALFLLLAHGGGGALLRRWLVTFKALFTTGEFIYIRPQPTEAAAMRFPYAVAIAVGTTVCLWWLGRLDSLLEIVGGIYG
ncbi:MAG: A24 family peptidase [Pseudomonadota bacterium]